MVDGYLMHHGIKGQKWGIRRFQNEDGSYTEIGKIRRNSNKPLRVSKGRLVYRAVRNGEEDFMNRKYTYVNITDEYYRHSMATSEGFDGDMGNDYEMKTTKDLKIATTDDYFYAACKVMNVDPNIFIKDIPKSVKSKGYEAIRNRKLDHKYIEGMYNNITKEYDNNVFYKVADILQKEGYDGVVDPIDGNSSNYNEIIPSVIFDPKNKLKIVDYF